jgi:hypothetical protein
MPEKRNYFTICSVRNSANRFIRVCSVAVFAFDLKSAQERRIDTTGANSGSGRDFGSNQPHPAHFSGSRSSGSVFGGTSTATNTECHSHPSSRRLKA